ncbi:hypothetical protein [Enterococcus lactis]|uniref:hypothetical protein n=1 Tax=Enterococcus lactis TaxID=357441 RepID=UPI0040422FBC
MSNQTFIEIGSSIPETIEIDELAHDYFGFPKPQKILIVEGISDKECIERFYYHQKKKPKFEIRTASLLDEKRVDGKKNALAYYHENKSDQEIRVLLDRDYDFILDLYEKEENIYYYDYYELENYLFDEEVLEEYIVNTIQDFSPEEVRESLDKIKDTNIEMSFSLFYKIVVIREIYYNKIYNFDFDESIIESFAKMIKKLSFSAILNGNHPFCEGTTTIEDRIENFFKKSLLEIDDSLYNKIMNFWEDCEYSSPENFIQFCQHYFKGKALLKSIDSIFNSINVSCLKFTGNIIDLLLKNIIFKSTRYRSKILSIEESFG